jgi:hypothetical protein
MKKGGVLAVFLFVSLFLTVSSVSQNTGSTCPDTGGGYEMLF